MPFTCRFATAKVGDSSKNRTSHWTCLGTRGSKSLLLVRRVEPPRLAAWYLAGPRLEVEVSLEQSAPNRTLATVIVTGPWRPEILGPRRRLAHSAVDRLYALVQTAASL